MTEDKPNEDIARNKIGEDYDRGNLNNMDSVDHKAEREKNTIDADKRYSNQMKKANIEKP
jgi:hypothetical protein